MPKQKSNGGAGLGKPIAFRLSDADREAYLAKVARSGMTQSEFFRHAVLTNRTQVIARPVASGDRKRLLYIFNKTSNNLNQIAHRANSEHVRGKLSEATYEQLLTQMQLIGQYLKATLNKVD
ncbi:plasmid mobilization protein [Paraburkholderia fungorum]|uniref:plasmid mobilization protein n=1 Tax=Paraburkholderia fungorum TaxID=134537 RepID=UPI002097F736|nr:plasmid mobilization relaxosome protein MobC [Paraburkholderia fungorum]USX06637.1 MobC family plasmid mobilization relaxosome protein [Paraburkholderia fungorum]